MSNYIEYNDKIVFHPGYYIKEIIDDIGITQEDFAKRLDTTPKNLSLLIRGEQALSIDMASKLSRMMDTSVVYWLNLQKLYDAAVADSILADMLSAEREIFEVLDYKYFCKYFGFPNIRGEIDHKIKLVRDFLRVSTLTVLKKDNLAVCFRSEEDLTSEDVIKANAMVQIATNYALREEAPQYNKKRFDEAVNYALNCTSNHSKFFNEIKSEFAKAGVVLVAVPNLADSKTNGATKKIGNKIMLMVNERGESGDSFWFTLLHEIGHIMNDDYGISLEQDEGEKEKIANEYARNKLIPNERYVDFVNKGVYSEKSIIEFANQVNRDPGIIVGRLQHDGLVEKNNSKLNAMKRKYKICAYK